MYFDRIQHRKFAVVLVVLFLALAFQLKRSRQRRSTDRLSSVWATPARACTNYIPFWAFRRPPRAEVFGGQNLILESRMGCRKAGQLPALAAELVHLNVDIIVASGLSAVRPLKCHSNHSRRHGGAPIRSF